MSHSDTRVASSLTPLTSVPGRSRFLTIYGRKTETFACDAHVDRLVARELVAALSHKSDARIDACTAWIFVVALVSIDSWRTWMCPS